MYKLIYLEVTIDNVLCALSLIAFCDKWNNSNNYLDVDEGMP